MQPRVGCTVRAIILIGSGIARPVYAQVTSVSPGLPEHLGADGQPTLSLCFLDSPDPRVLGGADWNSAFKRHAGVRHASHQDVVDRKVSLAWIDVLPDAGEALDLEEFAAMDTFPQPEASPLTASQQEPAAPNNVLEKRGNINKLASIEGVTGTHPADSAIKVDGKLISVKDLMRGMYLDDLKMTVTDVIFSNDGTLYVHTKREETKPADATSTDDNKEKNATPMLVGATDPVLDPTKLAYQSEQMDGQGHQVKPGSTPDGFLAEDKQPSSDPQDQPYTHTDGDFAGADDPYGIRSQMTSQAFQGMGQGHVQGGIAPGDSAQHPALGNDAIGELEHSGEQTEENADAQHASESDSPAGSEGAEKGDDNKPLE